MEMLVLFIVILVGAAMLVGGISFLFGLTRTVVKPSVTLRKKAIPFGENDQF